MMPSYAYWLLLIVCSIAAALLAHQIARKKYAGDLSSRGRHSSLQHLPVGAPYKLVEFRYGWSLANPNDYYLGRAIVDYGEYSESEKKLLSWLIEFRPGNVVEVGANAGFLTVPVAQMLAAKGHNMVVFEPQPFLFQNLCANLALNGLTNVRAWPSACGTEATTLYFPAPSYNAPGNFGGVSMEKQADPASVDVPCVRLDDAIGSMPVSLLKIDVEGAELEVLQGASATILASRPIIYVENDREDKVSALIQWLLDHNYRLWWHGPELFNLDNFFRNPVNLYSNMISVNMLCFPAELPVPEFAGTEIKTANARRDRQDQSGLT